MFKIHNEKYGVQKLGETFMDLTWVYILKVVMVTYCWK